MTIADLRAAGVSDGQRERALRESRLHPVGRGVYSVGHRFLVDDASLLAATLAAGPGSVLAGVPSLCFYSVLSLRRTPVEVLVPNRRRRRHSGVLVATRPFHPRWDVRHRRGIPVLAAVPAFVDAAGRLSAGQLRVALAEAQTRRWLHRTAIAQLLDASAGRPGAVALRAALADLDPSKGRPASALERAWAAFAREAGLPAYERGGHVDVGDERLELVEMDVWFAEARLIVELDGGAFHTTARARARDNRRDRLLLAGGIRTIRVGWSDLDDDRAGLAACVRALLSV